MIAYLCKRSTIGVKIETEPTPINTPAETEEFTQPTPGADYTLDDNPARSQPIAAPRANGAVSQKASESIALFSRLNGSKKPLLSLAELLSASLNQDSTNPRNLGQGLTKCALILLGCSNGRGGSAPATGWTTIDYETGFRSLSSKCGCFFDPFRE